MKVKLRYFYLLSLIQHLSGSIELSSALDTVIEHQAHCWQTDETNSTTLPSLESTYFENNSLSDILQTLRKPKAREVFEGLQVQYVTSHNQTPKKWTILLYIAGDNDLYRFAIRNIEQLKQVGSEKINILVHFDYHQNGRSKETRRFFVQKDALIQVGTLQAMDSGSEKTLIDAASWALNNYPSKHFCLVLWNHGAGDLNPDRLSRLINPSEFFFYNPETRQIELDRNISFIEYLSHMSDRGICFDNTTGNYLDDKKLDTALQSIKQMRRGKNIDVILMDACLMAGIGTSWLCSRNADYLVASQEVVLGPGYNYTTTLRPLAQNDYSPEIFAKSVVQTYESTYGPITRDYTESAINLKYVKDFSDNVNKLATLILQYLPFDQSKSLAKTVKMCANKDFCTHFEEPSYIDIKHFYENLLHYCASINILNTEKQNFYYELKNIILEGLNIYQKLICANASGSNYSRASGLSIYFPQRYLHSSYKKTLFGQSNKWSEMIEKLVKI